MSTAVALLSFVWGAREETDVLYPHTGVMEGSAGTFSACKTLVLML